MSAKKKEDVLIYLKNLNFDKNLRNTLHAKYILNIRLVFLLVLTIIVFGISSLLSLDRKLNPEINIPLVNVVTTLPGASPKEIEELITIPIENEIKDAKDLINLQSYSQENVSLLLLEFKSGTDPDKAQGEISSLVGKVTLPQDAITPVIEALDFENQPIIVFSLTGTVDKESLYKKAAELKDALENDSKVKSVSLSGNAEREIVVRFTPESLNTYGLNPLDVSAQIKGNLNSFPSGTLRSNGSEFPFTIDKGIKSLGDLHTMPITVGDGVQLPLTTLAQVQDSRKESSPKSYFVGEDKIIKQAITLSVFKSDSAKIDEASSAAKEIADKAVAGSSSFKINVTQNAAEEITNQFSDLGRTFIETILLVFITLTLFLGLRQALVVSFTIPITFLIAFTVMQVMGISLNFLSAFSLLLSLGLLVDDAIVTTSAMTTYHKTGKFSPEETGLLVWHDFIVPIWTTTITTIWAFAPLLLSTGIIGEFIKSIPIVVSATLIASTSTAVLITLPLLITIFKGEMAKRVKIALSVVAILSATVAYASLIPKEPRPIYALSVAAFMLFLFSLFGIVKYLKYIFGSKYLVSGLINIDGAAKVYGHALKNILESKWAKRKVLAVVTVFSIASYALLPLGFVVNEFFPKIDSNLIFLNIELPIGTSQDHTEVETLKLISLYKNMPEVESIAGDIGHQIDTGSGEIPSSGGHTASITLKLKDENSISVAQKVRDSLKHYTTAKVSVVELSGGPPAGADLQINVFGPDLNKLEEITDEIKAYLEQNQNVINVQKSSVPGASKVTLQPNLSELSASGIPTEAIGILSRFYISGITVDSVTFDTLEADIILKSTQSGLSASSLGRIQVPSMSGPVPITSLGTIVSTPNPSVIRRENGNRAITVSGSVIPGASVSQENKVLQNFLENLTVPDAYSWQTGGVNEENQSSVNSILKAMVVAALLILITMVIQLGSFRKATIVLLVIPLAISGVFMLFALTKTPLSFPALIGVLALYGIVVNNSMMVIEKINQNLRSGIEFTASIVDAAESRVEPIFLTSLITIMGLVPITLSDPLWRGLGGAIIAGLSVSGTIMLFFIPVVYHIWLKPDDAS